MIAFPYLKKINGQKWIKGSILDNLTSLFCTEQGLPGAGNSTPFAKLPCFTLKRLAACERIYKILAMQHVVYILYNFVTFSEPNKGQLLHHLFLFV